eukprot:CAMPEP_0197833068 /NCGR_PEP_ID=MMETSP1437-20131217/17560_1 /TAXON_ID=49252 ORGANISM="Eucampia antarctica, Strain CCMP1452" /NCGR_SAMPLE_ID=MMETSP1437 /ASSEMBLY_ACC=CAM_ASM_001096 /LENGTH=228 /DNA_ID=CAMNT_0043436859 /DNA_START=165 /DNA_END=851 /DNA_ORIENTATION=-
MSTLFLTGSSSADWKGEVFSNEGDSGSIRGCSILKVEGSQTEYEATIDGVEADLGKFSDAIYKKITMDAKQQRYQGFRPGTIPPQLLPNYVSFAMDECAREATLEALAQNDIRPFESSRMDMKFEDISIPPVIKKKKKKKSGRKKNKSSCDTNDPSPITDVVEEPKWETFETMKEAIDAGWKPGQSFSFVAKSINGQKTKQQNVVGAKAIGAGGSYFDFNNVSVDSEN